MNWRLVFRLMYRWSLVSSAAIALFWLVWYLQAGTVPTEHLSRWADILIGPIWSCTGVLVYILLLGDLYTSGATGFMAAMCWLISLVAALGEGLVTGLMFLGCCLAVILSLVAVIIVGSLCYWCLREGVGRIPGVRAFGRWLAGG